MAAHSHGRRAVDPSRDWGRLGLPRRERRAVQRAVASVGESLLLVREQRVYLTLGFVSFADWCHSRVPAMFPAWQGATSSQVDEFVELAIGEATKRRRGR